MQKLDSEQAGFDLAGALLPCRTPSTGITPPSCTSSLRSCSMIYAKKDNEVGNANRPCGVFVVAQESDSLAERKLIHSDESSQKTKRRSCIKSEHFLHRFHQYSIRLHHFIRARQPSAEQQSSCCYFLITSLLQLKRTKHRNDEAPSGHHLRQYPKHLHRKSVRSSPA
jgi:hypothetical protein